MSWETPNFSDDLEIDQREEEKRQQSSPRRDAMLDPLLFLDFLRRNFFKIVILAAVFAGLGMTAFLLKPFPYKASALVLVDPRENRVTPGDAVVSGIGGDAVVLESVVEIILSDGFLLPVVKTLNLREHPQFAKELATAAIGDERKVIRAFRRNLSAFRRGATYVVEINYKAKDPDSAARFANAVAQAFVDSERVTRSSAATNAAEVLSDRLGSLRENLQKSEQAVASFRSQNGIFDVSETDTLQQRQLAEVSQRIAEAKANTEQIRAQYDQIRKSDAGSFNTLGDQSEAQFLQTLRQQSSELRQNLAELNLVFGPQHPRIVSGQTRLRNLDGQIEQERQRVVSLYKKRLDAAEAAQQVLASDLAKQTSQASRQEEGLVKLADLERQAAADRQIYNEFLTRFKNTDEQRDVQNTEVKIVSPASSPLTSTRPSKVLALGVIGALSLMMSVTTTFFLEAFGGPKQTKRKTASRSEMKSRREKVSKPFAGGEKPFVNREKPFVSKEKSFVERGEPVVEREIPINEPGGVNKKTRRQLSRSFLESLNFDLPEPTKKKQAFIKPKEATEEAEEKAISFVPRGDPVQPRRADTSFKKQDDVALSGVLPFISRRRLNRGGSLSDILVDKFLEMPALLPRELDRGHVVIVTSLEDGEGKTSVSRALADLSQKQGYDPIFLRSYENAARNLENDFGGKIEGFDYPVIDPMGRDLRDQSHKFQSGKLLEELLEQCRRNHGHILIDVASLKHERDMRRMLKLCDQMIFVMDEAKTTKDALFETVEGFERVGIDTDIIANKVRR